MKKNLFLLNDELSRPLLEIRKNAIMGIRDKQMIKFEVDTPRSLENFNEDQRTNRELLSNQINKIEGDII